MHCAPLALVVPLLIIASLLTKGVMRWQAGLTTTRGVNTPWPRRCHLQMSLPENAPTPLWTCWRSPAEEAQPEMTWTYQPEPHPHQHTLKDFIPLPHRPANSTKENNKVKTVLVLHSFCCGCSLAHSYQIYGVESWVRQPLQLGGIHGIVSLDPAQPISQKTMGDKLLLQRLFPCPSSLYIECSCAELGTTTARRVYVPWSNQWG